MFQMYQSERTNPGYLLMVRTYTITLYVLLICTYNRTEHIFKLYRCKQIDHFKDLKEFEIFL